MKKTTLRTQKPAFRRTAIKQAPVHVSFYRREILAGLTTFSAMMYILVVNPSMLSQTGMDKEAVLGATILSSAIMTAVMGLATNLPLALAPGMGLNAFFTYTICLQNQIPWTAALGLVFYSGILFFFVTLTGLRKKILSLIPKSIRLGLTAGIGLFIALIGLKNGGIIVKNEATLVGLGSITSIENLLVFTGILLAGVLSFRKKSGALLISIAFITVGFMLLGKVSFPTTLFSAPPSLEKTFFQLDLQYFWNHLGVCAPLLFSLFFVDLFDNVGTLLAVTTRANLVTSEGEVKQLDRALKSDAFAAILGSTLGTSSVVSYIESAAGVEQGGRTKWTALTVAACFLLALFISPLLLMVPIAATTPTLVLVGVSMMGEIAGINRDDLTESIPAFLTLILIPLSFSIADGFGIGLLSYAALKAARSFSGKLK
jgi:adenine/guanine/hypoxanthine permease